VGPIYYETKETYYMTKETYCVVGPIQRVSDGLGFRF